MCKCWYSVGITTQVQLPPCSVHWPTVLCRYEGSVDLNLNYRTQYDDFLYSSDAGAAERCACGLLEPAAPRHQSVICECRADRFENDHYFRSHWYFDFNRTVGSWFERPYAVHWCFQLLLRQAFRAGWLGTARRP